MTSRRRRHVIWASQEGAATKKRFQKQDACGVRTPQEKGRWGGTRNDGRHFGRARREGIDCKKKKKKPCFDVVSKNGRVWIGTKKRDGKMKDAVGQAQE